MKLTFNILNFPLSSVLPASYVCMFIYIFNGLHVLSRWECLQSRYILVIVFISQIIE